MRIGKIVKAGLDFGRVFGVFGEGGVRFWCLGGGWDGEGVRVLLMGARVLCVGR
jgi:hypothetical protein